MLKKLSRKLASPLALVVALPAIMLANHFVSKAVAGDRFVVQLQSSDGGATQVAAILPYQWYDIWCANPAVYKTDIMNAAGTVVGDGGISMTIDVPAQIFQVPASTAVVTYSTWNGAGLEGGATTVAIPRGRFYSGLDTGIVAIANDAGNPQCNISLAYGGF